MCYKRSIADYGPCTCRVALVTAGTRGIGRAIVLELAKGGADVAFNHAKSADAAESLKAELESLGVRALPVQCDVADTEAAAEMRSEERRVGKECRSRWWPYR